MRQPTDRQTAMTRRSARLLLDVGECAAQAAGLWGCRFDAQGNETECGMATLDEKTDTLTIMTVLAAVFLPLILLAHGFAYSRFKREPGGLVRLARRGLEQLR